MLADFCVCELRFGLAVLGHTVYEIAFFLLYHHADFKVKHNLFEQTSLLLCAFLITSFCKQSYGLHEIRLT